MIKRILDFILSLLTYKRIIEVGSELFFTECIIFTNILHGKFYLPFCDEKEQKLDPKTKFYGVKKFGKYVGPTYTRTVDDETGIITVSENDITDNDRLTIRIYLSENDIIDDNYSATILENLHEAGFEGRNIIHHNGTDTIINKGIWESLEDHTLNSRPRTYYVFGNICGLNRLIKKGEERNNYKQQLNLYYNINGNVYAVGINKNSDDEEKTVTYFLRDEYKPSMFEDPKQFSIDNDDIDLLNPLFKVHGSFKGDNIFVIRKDGISKKLTKEEFDVYLQNLQSDTRKTHKTLGRTLGIA